MSVSNTGPVLQPRPRPIEQVVTAATTGATMWALVAAVATGLLDLIPTLPISESLLDWIRAILMIAATVAGALRHGRNAQEVAERKVTPLADPRDKDMNELVPVQGTGGSASYKRTRRQ